MLDMIKIKKILNSNYFKQYEYILFKNDIKNVNFNSKPNGLIIFLYDNYILVYFEICKLNVFVIIMLNYLFGNYRLELIRNPFIESILDYWHYSCFNNIEVIDNKFIINNEIFNNITFYDFDTIMKKIKA